MEDTEPELATSHNQERLPVEGLGPQHSLIAFDLQFSLPTEVKGNSEIMGVVNK